MTRTLTIFARALVLMLPILPATLTNAQSSNSKADANFAPWWSQFQSAVSKGDGQTVARGAQFPMDWENHAIRSIASESDFVKKFGLYFTAPLKKIVMKNHPERLPNGVYILTWHADGNEYSLYFKPLGSTFALDGLSEGPP
jgi:hypothetical protein